MKQFRIFFEVTGIAQDEKGLPVPAGMQIDFGETEKDFDYAEVTKDLNIPGILEYMHLDGLVRPENVTIITPEEYDAKYAEEEVPYEPRDFE